MTIVEVSNPCRGAEVPAVPGAPGRSHLGVGGAALPARAAVLGARPVLLRAPVQVGQVGLLLQLRWLLRGGHQHGVALAAILRVVGVFSLVGTQGTESERGRGWAGGRGAHRAQAGATNSHRAGHC